MNAQDEILTVIEVADLLKVTPGTLLTWRRRGYGPQGIRMGRVIRYRRSAVHAWIEGQERGAA